MRANGCAWRYFIYKDIDHILNSKHECALPRLPKAMAPMVIFLSFIRTIELKVDNGAYLKDLYMSVPKNRWPGRLCRRETTWDHRRH
jgi:hypothetical protein